MDVSATHRTDVLKKIVSDLVVAMEQNKVTEEEVSKIATFALEKVDKTTNHDELIKLLDEMSKQWPFFENIEQIERGEVKEVLEDKVEIEVLNLAKNRKIEEAIALAKTVTG